MLQLRLAAELRTRDQLHALKLACDDTSWVLKTGDIVYYRDDACPSSVMRCGYGAYEGQVRIGLVTEDLQKFATGQWVSTADCHLLEHDDKLRATTDLEDATESRRHVTKGSTYRFRGFDKDGDILLDAISEGRVLLMIMFRDQLQFF